MLCPTCQEEFTVTRDKKKYCSRTCSAKAGFAKYNAQRAANPKEYFCQGCNSSIGKGWKVSHRKYCDSCNPNKVDWSQVTIADFRSRYSDTLQYHSRLRSLSRTSYGNTDRPCESCGYDKHIQVCHKRPLADFPETASVAEVNDPTNLIGLCPNCHWELDNGLLTL